MISEESLPPYQYVAAYLLACLAASAAVSLAVMVQDGDRAFLGAFFLFPIVVIPVGILGAVFGLPVHFLVFRPRRHVSLLFAMMIGIVCGVVATVVGGLIVLDLSLTRQLLPFGALAGCIASIVWWITILKPLNGTKHG